MKPARIALLLLLTASLAQATSYPQLLKEWDINLGGDTLDIRDVGGDGGLDITIGLFREQGSYAYLLDSNGTLQWRNKISVIWPQNSPNTLVVDDIDGNGNTDIVVGSVVEAKKDCSVGLSEFPHPTFMLERDMSLQNNLLKWSHNGYGFPVSMDAADIDGAKGK